MTCFRDFLDLIEMVSTIILCTVGSLAWVAVLPGDTCYHTAIRGFVIGITVTLCLVLAAQAGLRLHDRDKERSIKEDKGNISHP